MNYLELVNKVIEESASEQDELTEDTWDSLDASRRLYPRIKRNVATAWKQIQMSRDEWEFNSKEVSTVVYPRLRIVNGFRTAGEPTAGVQFTGTGSVFTFTVRSVDTTDGDWAAGTAIATIEFGTYSGNQLRPDDTFVEVGMGTDGTLVFLGRGSYTFLEVQPRLDEIEWATFTGVQQNTVPSTISLVPIKYIPYDNWFYNNFDFTNSALTVPQYVSQDYKGQVVFYPQTFNPFRVSFIGSLTPQILSAFDDEPEGLKEEYHEWIAWEALNMVALFDKNPDLYAYANKQCDFFSYRAENNLMPNMSWSASSFNV